MKHYIQIRINIARYTVNYNYFMKNIGYTNRPVRKIYMANLTYTIIISA